MLGTLDAVPDEAGIPALWLVIGFIGQAMFFSRFLVQWIASEQAGRSVVPLAFWYLSIAGGLITLCYAIFRQDPVFIAGQATGSVVYFRNLILIAREKKDKAP